MPNLQRGMAVLEYLAANQHIATLTELSERLGSRQGDRRLRFKRLTANTITTRDAFRA